MNHPISQRSRCLPVFFFVTVFVAVNALTLSPAFAQKLLIPVPLGEPTATGMIQSTEVGPLSDPERWTKEDLTWEEQYATAKKETLAAFQIAKSECQSLSQPEQSFCLIQAKSVMDKEMSAINKRFGVPE